MIKTTLILHDQYWWIKIRQGTWAGGEFIKGPTFGKPTIGRYSKNNKSFWIIGTDEHYEMWRVKPLRRIPTFKE